MDDITQAIPANHRFVHLHGHLTVTIARGGVHTYNNLGDDDAADLHAEFVHDFATNAGPDARVVVQYGGDTDGNEAGSMWFDMDNLTDSPLEAAAFTPAELAAGMLLGRLNEIDEAFGAGRTFVA